MLKQELFVFLQTSYHLSKKDICIFRNTEIVCHLGNKNLPDMRTKV